MNKLIAVLFRGERPAFFQKERFLYALVSTVLFGVAAHGYCYFNLTYSHDSLLVCQEIDGRSQVSIGRFFLPVYLKVRGSFYAPWLTGLLSLLFLGLAAYIILSLLEIKNGLLCSLGCGVLAVNASLTLTNATYLKDADVYMLAFFLAAAAVWLWARVPWGFLPAAAALCLSLGLYQAFFQAAVFLSMVYVVKTALDGADTKMILLTGASALAALLLGLIVYGISLNAILAAAGMELSDTYNGLSRVGHFGGLSEFVRLIQETYRSTFDSFTRPETGHSGVMSGLNKLLAAAAAIVLLRLIQLRCIRGWPLALLLADVVLMPFGINVVYLISQGVEHSLMRFSFYLFYVFTAMLLDLYWRDRASFRTWITGFSWVIPGILAVFIFNSVVYANQVYLKKDLEYQTTLLTMNRIVDRIEQTEGYIAGETPVALIGTLSGSVLSVFLAGKNSHAP